MAAQHSPRFLAIVNDAKSRIRETDVDAVKARLDEGETLTIVDVRAAGTGTAPHLAGELFAMRSGIEMTHVPYKGSAPSVTALVADEATTTFAGLRIPVPSKIGSVMKSASEGIV